MTPSHAERLLILGDSLTAGYGVTRESSFPTQLEQLAREAGLQLTVINGGMSGDTSAGGVRRLNWFLREEPNLFMLALGGNDALRGVPTGELERNLDQIFSTVRTRYPRARLILAGMEAPPNMGEEYRVAYRATFRTVAERHQAHLIPFLLDGVGGNPEFNQPDRIHPNEAGHRKIAELLFAALRPLLATETNTVTADQE